MDPTNKDETGQLIDFEVIQSSAQSTPAINSNSNLIAEEPNQKAVLGLSEYNDYVNQLYEEQNLSTNCDYNQQTSNVIDQLNGEEPEDKPLLGQRKPKSIVKSPSSASFKLITDDITSKRLSWQAHGHEESVERPVLHVQFQQSSDSEPKACSSGSSNKSYFNNSTVELVSENDAKTSASSSSDSSALEDDFIDQFSDEYKILDGGYGWVIVFASFMVNLIADGITFSFGMFYVEFLNYFGESKGKTAWIGSLFMAIPLLSGPIASFLTDMYGCRKVTIFGAILATIGFLLSAMADSMEMLFITFGIISGFGLSLCYVAAVVIVAYYFEKKRSFATGISVCGSGIGTFIFPPIIQILIEYFGWRGAIVILAGAFLNMCVFGALMRSPDFVKHRKKKNSKLKQKKDVSADSLSFSNSTNAAGGTLGNIPNTLFGPNEDFRTAELHPQRSEDDPHLFSSLINLPTFIRNGEKIPLETLELLSKNRNINDVLLQYPHLLQSRSFGHSPVPRDKIAVSPLSPGTMDNYITNNLQHKDHRSNSHAFLKNLRVHRQSLTYRGAMLNINRYRLRASSCPDVYKNSMTTIAKEKTALNQRFDDFKRLFVDILDFSYFLDIRFLLFAISNFILYTWYDVPYVYLADHAIKTGTNIDETDASMLISLIGILNMFGEIALGWAGDRKDMLKPNMIYAICMGLCGIIVILIPLSNSYQWLCVLSGGFGLFIAANYSLTSIILVELITLERFTNAYGLLLLVQGIANLVGPPLAGWLFDLTGTYDLSFYLAGAMIIVSGLLLLILPSISKYKKYQQKKADELSSKANGNVSSVKAEKKMIDEIKNNGSIKDCFGKDTSRSTVSVSV